jgi:hypothetical protein
VREVSNRTKETVERILLLASRLVSREAYHGASPFAPRTLCLQRKPLPCQVTVEYSPTIAITVYSIYNGSDIVSLLSLSDRQVSSPSSLSSDSLSGDLSSTLTSFTGGAGEDRLLRPVSARLAAGWLSRFFVLAELARVFRTAAGLAGLGGVRSAAGDEG